MYTILVTGSRTIIEYNIVEKALDTYDIFMIVSGGAYGPDMSAIRYAKLRQKPVLVWYAQWDKLGKSAGIKRNIAQADYVNEKNYPLCIAFWDGKSKGTKHQIDYCKYIGMQVVVYNERGEYVETY